MTRRILITSYVFPPGVGGIERATLALARMLAAIGHTVTVVTMEQEPWAAEVDEPYTVVRAPGVRETVGLFRAAEVVIVNNPSFRLQWPLLAVRRPHLTVLHAALEDGTTRLRLVKALKVAALRSSSAVVSVSAALAAKVPIPSVVIPNTYDPGPFAAGDGAVDRRPAVVYLGRLVRQKGVDVLLEAVALLRERGRRVELTVIGDGSERSALEAQTAELGIGDLVRFAGTMGGRELGEALRAHTVLAVPSRGHEPFGIIALEGLAAGCAVVVTESGGPPEAVGDCGLVVPQEDAPALADAIDRLLTDEALRARLAAGVRDHLDRHSPSTIGAEFDELIEQAARRR